MRARGRTLIQTWLRIGLVLCCDGSNDAITRRPSTSVVTLEPGAHNMRRPLSSPAHLTTLLNIMPVLYTSVERHIALDDLKKVFAGNLAVHLRVNLCYSTHRCCVNVVH
jgi:hypothetical protein